jgi:hypothetical protein
MSIGPQDYPRNLSKPSMIKALAAEPDLMPQARGARAGELQGADGTPAAVVSSAVDARFVVNHRPSGASAARSLTRTAM